MDEPSGSCLGTPLDIVDLSFSTRSAEQTQTQGVLDSSAPPLERDLPEHLIWLGWRNVRYFFTTTSSSPEHSVLSEKSQTFTLWYRS